MKEIIKNWEDKNSPIKERERSKIFKQSAFTKTEMKIHPMVTGAVTLLIFILEVMFIPGKSASSLWSAGQYGQIALWFLKYYFLLNSCIVQAIVLKYLIYCLIGKIYGVEPLSANDDFWLYDSPINPINVPSFIVFDKIDGDPEEFINTILRRIGRGHRCTVKLTKIFGKYYFEKLTDEEYKVWKSTRVGIKSEIKTEKEAVEFALQLKAQDGKDFKQSSVYCYFFPSLNNDTESALMIQGHHCYQDGISQMQSFFKVSDQPPGQEYPFFNKPSPSFLQWCLIYITFPIGWKQFLDSYQARKKDVNCIKQYRRYMTGNYKSRLSKQISMRKIKSKAKEMGVTFNDLITGIVSKSLKMHFNEQGDTTDYISLGVPFTFQSIPTDMSKYKFGNNFVVLTLYVDLKDTIVEACTSAKKVMDKLKRSMIPGGGYTMMQFFTTFCPHVWVDHIFHSAGAKHTLLLSNVPGFQKPVYYGGKPAKRFFSLVTGSGNLATGISVVSMPEITQISVTADDSQIKDIDQFMSYFDSAIQELDIEID